MVGNVSNLTGNRFGNLLVVGRSDRLSKNHYWSCLCDCGGQHSVRTDHLIDGKVVRCKACTGVWRSERFGKHGLAGTRIYSIWQNMLRRCHDPKNTAFKNYGARGITVASEWSEFSAFLKDMGLPPSEKYTLDRIDNSSGYCKGNCRWVTGEIQANNTRRNVLITFSNETLSRSQWARKVGLHVSTLEYRLRRGWSIERALTTPCQKKG